MPMPSKGSDTSRFLDIDVKKIVSMEFLTVNEDEGIMHGQADPNDGKFLFMWFLKDSHLYLVRKGDSIGELNPIIDNSLVKVTIKYTDQC